MRLINRVAKVALCILLCPNIPPFGLNYFAQATPVSTSCLLGTNTLVSSKELTLVFVSYHKSCYSALNYVFEASLWQKNFQMQLSVKFMSQEQLFVGS